MDNGYEFLKNVRLVKEVEAQRKAKYKADSKDRLKKIARKKIQTTMIGALATIEENLGFLWDGDSSQAKKLKELYNNIRQEILDRGNDQIRKLDTEIDQYDIEWLRFNLVLPVKKRDKDNDNS